MNSLTLPRWFGGRRKKSKKDAQKAVIKVNGQQHPVFHPSLGPLTPPLATSGQGLFEGLQQGQQLQSDNSSTDGLRRPRSAFILGRGIRTDSKFILWAKIDFLSYFNKFL